MEWQDREGIWHAVEGWQGTLDEVAVEDDTVVGRKAWWVDESDLGTGPFRSVLRHQGDERVLGVSDSFLLPDILQGTTTVNAEPDP